MLKERDLAVTLWRQVLDPAEGVTRLLQPLMTPVLGGGRRIGDDEIDRGQSIVQRLPCLASSVLRTSPQAWPLGT